MRNANHKRVAAAISAHRNSLARDYEKTYFKANRLWLVPGLLVSVHKLQAGRFLLNTLRIRENLGRDPAAERLLRNMLRYAAVDPGRLSTAR